MIMSTYPRVNDAGETVWACCESRIGGPCQHRAPQSGYTTCACRDCFDVTVSSDMSMPELCGPCEGAGCTAHADLPDFIAAYGLGYECQREDAYGN